MEETVELTPILSPAGLSERWGKSRERLEGTFGCLAPKHFNRPSRFSSWILMLEEEMPGITASRRVPAKVPSIARAQSAIRYHHHYNLTGGCQDENWMPA